MHLIDIKAELRRTIVTVLVIRIIHTKLPFGQLKKNFFYPKHGFSDNSNDLITSRGQHFCSTLIAVLRVRHNGGG